MMFFPCSLCGRRIRPGGPDGSGMMRPRREDGKASSRTPGGDPGAPRPAGAVTAMQHARVVELTYFGGLNRDEIAEVLKVSTVTIRRDWVFARAWLYTQLQNAG